ncbi:MAG: 4Fe-4S binding protein [Chloroflexi bacterium]|nr:4Fe-4S binding protein [Chloroflexota bacterium]
MTAGVSTKKPKKKIFLWTALRKTVQALAFLTFVILAVSLHSKIWPITLSSGIFSLDPLATLAHLLASRTFLAGSALALLLVLFTIIFGRAWCGWLCPLGTLLDWFPLRSKRKSPVQIPEAWRRVKYLLLIAILFSALLANLTLLVLDPLTLLFRTLTTAIWPSLDYAFSVLESALVPIPIFQAPVSTLDSLLRPTVFPISPAVYRYGLLYLAILAGVILLNLAAPRFWCRYLCPLGGFLGWISKIAIFQRRVSSTCKNCNLCLRDCPTGTIQPDRGYVSDPEECTLCMECLARCPKGAENFTLSLPKPALRSYDPQRRHAFQVFGLAAAAIVAMRASLSSLRSNPWLIQPPGARENNLISKCIRCGECVRVCPTSGLQPAITEAGAEGLWTPVLVPRIGYCDYACNACGQACPVQAIPPLSLDEKRQQIIGKAYIDQNRCIAWSDHIPCIVCEEMCPLPDKAVKLEISQVVDASGNAVYLQLPYVIRDQCIGCGICEYKCPVAHEAAIRIYAPMPPVL